MGVLFPKKSGLSELMTFAGIVMEMEFVTGYAGYLRADITDDDEPEDEETGDEEQEVIKNPETIKINENNKIFLMLPPFFNFYSEII